MLLSPAVRPSGSTDVSPGLARALVLWRLNLDVPRRPPSEFRRRFHTCTNFDYHQHYLTAIEGGLVPPRISISGSDPATGGQLPPGISFMIGPEEQRGWSLDPAAEPDLAVCRGVADGLCPVLSVFLGAPAAWVTARPSGSRTPASSNKTTPLQRRLQPCSGWTVTARAAVRSGARASGQRG